MIRLVISPPPKHTNSGLASETGLPRLAPIGTQGSAIIETAPMGHTPRPSKPRWAVLRLGAESR